MSDSIDSHVEDTLNAGAVCVTKKQFIFTALEQDCMHGSLIWYAIR